MELKVPVAPLLRVTMPVGVVAVPAEVSLTVAVQVVRVFTGSEAGVQLMLVDVARLLTVSAKLAEPLLWSVSPP